MVEFVVETNCWKISWVNKNKNIFYRRCSLMILRTVFCQFSVSPNQSWANHLLLNHSITGQLFFIPDNLTLQKKVNNTKQLQSGSVKLYLMTSDLQSNTQPTTNTQPSQVSYIRLVRSECKPGYQIFHLWQIISSYVLDDCSCQLNRWPNIVNVSAIFALY